MNYTKITLNVIGVFIVMIIASLIPDLFSDFFGDWKCEGKSWDTNVNFWIGCDMGGGRHLAKMHWGWRHWLFMFMGLSVFIIQVVRIINLINQKSTKNA